MLHIRTEETMSDAITRILVPLDFGPQADAVVAYATAIAAPVRASIDLLHVIVDPAGAHDWVADLYLREMTAIRERAIAEAEQHLNRYVARCALSGVEARRRVVIGRPTPVILAEARTQSADLIVMGTHGRTGLAHVLLGSVAEQVVRAAPCPVLTVRTDGRERVPIDNPVGAPILSD
jgi:universal stress protein A